MTCNARTIVFFLGALRLLYPEVAGAATILTPAQLQSYHGIYSYSVWQADSTIALDAFDGPTPTGLLRQKIWTIQRFATMGQELTTEPAPHDPKWAPLQYDPDKKLVGTFQSGFLAYTAWDTTRGIPSLFVQGLGLRTPGLTAGSYSWSLDAANLVFEGCNNCSLGGDLGLYTVAWNSNVPRMIKNCSSPPYCGNPQWSPSVDVIAYNSQFNGIWLINPDGTGDHMILGPGNSDPVWSPNTGAYMAYSCNAGADVCVATSDGVNPTNITNGALGLKYSNPSWSIAEDFIAMIGSVSGSLQGDLYVIAFNLNPSAPPTPVAWTTTGNVANPQWSPDTDEIFYVCGHDLCVTSAPNAPPATCDSSCAGCCYQTLCVSGVSNQACGAGGIQCVPCPSGQTCSSETHTCGSLSCNSGNCANGCCDSSNVCRDGTGTKTNTCGIGAEPCTSCIGNEVCDPTQRICLANLCSAATCSGCCDPQTGKCQNGTSNDYCGPNGLQCTKCTGGSSCSINRRCETNGCTASNCATGCCDSNNNCQNGTDPGSCGYAGRSCVSCNGGVCDANTHQCGAPNTCLPCSGCCGAADNKCYAGTSTSACGFGGFICGGPCLPGQTCSSSLGSCL